VHRLVCAGICRDRRDDKAANLNSFSDDVLKRHLAAKVLNNNFF
jgi:hypothetical protein